MPVGLVVAAVWIAWVTGCASPPSSPAVHRDAKLDLYNATARLEFDDGRPAEAADAYALSLDRATIIDDPGAATTAAYGLAIMRAASLDYPGALAALDIAAYDAYRANVDPTDLLLVRARVELLGGNPAEASRVADQVLAEPRSKPTPLRQAQAHVLKGLCACRASDVGGATAEFAAARTLAGGSDSPSMRAMLAGLSGEIHSGKKDSVAAASDFDRQAELCRQAADYRTMYRALAKAGRAYGSSGEANRSADRLYRAARAAVASDGRDEASLVVEAIAAAKAANDPRLMRLTAALSNRVGKN